MRALATRSYYLLLHCLACSSTLLARSSSQHRGMSFQRVAYHVRFTKQEPRLHHSDRASLPFSHHVSVAPPQDPHSTCTEVLISPLALPCLSVGCLLVSVDCLSVSAGCLSLLMWPYLAIGVALNIFMCCVRAVTARV